MGKREAKTLARVIAYALTRKGAARAVSVTVPGMRVPELMELLDRARASGMKMRHYGLPTETAVELTGKVGRVAVSVTVTVSDEESRRWKYA